jgi:hypothetical protein
MDICDLMITVDETNEEKYIGNRLRTRRRDRFEAEVMYRIAAFDSHSFS